MALYFPEQDLAIDLADDPESAPVDPTAFPGMRTVRLSCAQLADPATFDELARLFARGRDALAQPTDHEVIIARRRLTRLINDLLHEHDFMAGGCRGPRRGRLRTEATEGRAL